MKDRLGSFAKIPHLSRKTTLLIAFTIVMTLIISSLVSMWISRVTHFTFPTIGTVKWRGVEGYWDSDLTNKTTECSWGIVWPGEAKNVSLYLRSTGNIETTLNLAAENWRFSDSENHIVEDVNNSSKYMNLAWNYNNTIVQPGEVLQVTLTLSVDRSSGFVDFLMANDVRAFSVDIIISTSEQS